MEPTKRWKLCSASWVFWRVGRQAEIITDTGPKTAPVTIERPNYCAIDPSGDCLLCAMRQSRTRFQRTKHLCYRYTDPSLFSSDALPHRDDSIQPARPPKEFRVLLLKS
jgi:hypothetical protein